MLSFSLITVTVRTSEVQAQSHSMGEVIVIDNNIDAVYQGLSPDGLEIWTARVTEKPRFTDDGQTISPRWLYDSDSMQWYADNNLYEATVNGSEVTITYENKTLTWNPDINIGEKELITPMSSLSMVVDPITEGYYGNILKWEYANGITRELRITEGKLTENYIVSEVTKDDVIIDTNAIMDADYVWKTPILTLDALNETVKVIENDDVVILPVETIKDTPLPITIDPDSNFVATASDGYMEIVMGDSSSWAYVRDNDTAHAVSAGGSTAMVISGNYANAFTQNTLYRAFLPFNTAGLPDECYITNATLGLEAGQTFDNEDAGIVILSGMPTYPSDPMVVTDYDRTLYDEVTVYGEMDVSEDGWSDGSHSNITLNYVDTLINKQGTTKLLLREHGDFANDRPPYGTGNTVKFSTSEAGASNRPTLYITYLVATEPPQVSTLSATYVSISTAQLNAYITNDGGQPCDVRFQYNETLTPCNTTNAIIWTVNTTWVNDTYTTGIYPYKAISGLTNNTMYFFRVQARNANSTVSGSVLCFTTGTAMEAPTGLQAYPGSHDVELSWTKASGSNNTILRGQVGNYPANITDGTNVYNSSGSSATHEGLSPGITYYYRAWGEAGGVNSTNYTDVLTTTYAGVGGDDAPTDPVAPSTWWSPANYTNMANFTLYPIINDLADDYGLPRNTMWTTLTIILIMTIGIIIYATAHQPAVAILTVGALMWVASVMGLMPFWIALLYTVPAISIMLMARRT